MVSVYHCMAHMMHASISVTLTPSVTCGVNGFPSGGSLVGGCQTVQYFSFPASKASLRGGGMGECDYVTLMQMVVLN